LCLEYFGNTLEASDAYSEMVDIAICTGDFVKVQAMFDLYAHHGERPHMAKHILCAAENSCSQKMLKWLMCQISLQNDEGENVYVEVDDLIKRVTAADSADKKKILKFLNRYSGCRLGMNVTGERIIEQVASTVPIAPDVTYDWICGL
jgi:hypothetical protein